MKAIGFKYILLVTSVLILTSNLSYAQYKTSDEARDFINDRLSHSLLQKIDPDGMVTMSAPGKKIKFKLREVSFNYNGGNNDDRVRVFCDNCIEHYEKKYLEERTSRQSFVCGSEKEANEVIYAFKFLKKQYAASTGSMQPAEKKLKVSDSTISAKTVGEAIDFINENLSYSMVTSVNDQGIMTINAPDEIYEVDLRKAEFGYNDAGDGSKVRIYGDFCIAMKESDGDMEKVTRKSFQTAGRVKAYQAITVLYYLKATYSDLDPAKITGLPNVNGARVNKYSNVSEAIDFINSRLSYSIVLSVDKTGNMVINAPEDIYRFNIHEVKPNTAWNHGARSDWFPFVINSGGPATGVMFECDDCIKQYEEPESFDTLDEQVFQCGSMTEAKDVLTAFTYIRGIVKK